MEYLARDRDRAMNWFRTWFLTEPLTFEIIMISRTSLKSTKQINYDKLIKTILIKIITHLEKYLLLLYIYILHVLTKVLDFKFI